MRRPTIDFDFFEQTADLVLAAGDRADVEELARDVQTEWIDVMARATRTRSRDVFESLRTDAARLRGISDRLCARLRASTNNAPTKGFDR